jgi:hypothetical protein
VSITIMMSMRPLPWELRDASIRLMSRMRTEAVRA